MEEAMRVGAKNLLAYNGTKSYEATSMELRRSKNFFILFFKVKRTIVKETTTSLHNLGIAKSSEITFVISFVFMKCLTLSK